MKFCTQIDEEIEGTETAEQWELVFFPMYHAGQEIGHGTIVSYDDSVVNGNLIVENGKVISASSNHCAWDYREIQDPVVNFAKDYIENILKNCS